MANGGEVATLLESGKALLINGNFNEGRLKVWRIQGKRTLGELYDEEISQEFDRIFSGGMVVRRGMDFYKEYYSPQIRRALDLLESLQIAAIPKRSQGESSPTPGPQSITVTNGTVILGNHNTVTDVTVKDILLALEKEMGAKAPEGQEKKEAMSAIKTLTTNETFATVVGQTLGAFLGQTFR